METWGTGNTKMSRKQRPFGSFPDDSDSDDSDYCPGSESPTEDEILTKSKRRKLERTSSETVSKRTPRKTIKNTKEDQNQWISNGSHILRQFPPEILVKVFQYGVESEGAVKFIPRITKVCRSWYEVSQNPLVWCNIDIPVQTLKLNIAKINQLLSNDLSCCRELKLTGQKIKDSSIMAILEATPGLRALDLSDCYRVKSSILQRLPTLSPQLTKLNLCFTAEFAMNINISSIEHFLVNSGKQLVELRLSRILCVQTSARQIFAAVEKNCPNLKILDLSIPDPNKSTAYPSRRFEFDADAFFEHCSKIQELSLDGFNLIRPKALGPSSNLIKLKQLHSLSQSYHCHEPSEVPVFYRMFGATSHLHYLDISHSKLLPSMVTSSLKAVTELVMRDMKWRDTEHGQLFDCLEAWKYCLVRLDLSFNVLVDSGIDAALLVYTAKKNYPLQTLKLKYSNVTATSIQTVLKNCGKLQEIDLTSCRELPRGCKHLVVKREFKFLEKCLHRS